MGELGGEPRQLHPDLAEARTRRLGQCHAGQPEVAQGMFDQRALRPRQGGEIRRIRGAQAEGVADRDQPGHARRPGARRDVAQLRVAAGIAVVQVDVDAAPVPAGQREHHVQMRLGVAVIARRVQPAHKVGALGQRRVQQPGRPRMPLCGKATIWMSTSPRNRSATARTAWKFSSPISSSISTWVRSAVVPLAIIRRSRAAARRGTGWARPRRYRRSFSMRSRTVAAPLLGRQGMPISVLSRCTCPSTRAGSSSRPPRSMPPPPPACGAMAAMRPPSTITSTCRPSASLALSSRIRRPSIPCPPPSRATVASRGGAAKGASLARRFGGTSGREQGDGPCRTPPPRTG